MLPFDRPYKTAEKRRYDLEDDHGFYGSIKANPYSPNGDVPPGSAPPTTLRNSVSYTKDLTSSKKADIRS